MPKRGRSGACPKSLIRLPLTTQACRLRSLTGSSVRRCSTLCSNPTRHPVNSPNPNPNRDPNPNPNPNPNPVTLTLTLAVTLTLTRAARRRSCSER